MKSQRLTSALALALAAILPTVPATAQSLVAGPAETGRYAIEPVQGGIARLDTMTGAVSFCSVAAGLMICRDSQEAGPPEPGADATADRPQGLADRRGEAERPIAGGDDAEFDRAMGRMREVFRVFRDIAREFDDPSDERNATPNRT